MTEVGLVTLNPPSGEIRQGSIGTPICGCSIALRDDQGGPIEPGEVGRIWIRSDSRMLGYWQAPEATGKVVIDDWLDSGDLARADEDGYLWFFGRKKQVIVHDGSNTHERENVRAYVTLSEGAEPPSRADLIEVGCPVDEVLVFCRERIGYKAPEEIVFQDDMRLNPTGKIDRVALRLREMAEDHLHPHGLSEG